ncbi:MAG: hypothetical protein MZV70_57655 [Desulfobacterales bacterium]|nr:hypothetical protein [Desulfobacterales bacterium]
MVIARRRFVFGKGFTVSFYPRDGNRNHLSPDHTRKTMITTMPINGITMGSRLVSRKAIWLAAIQRKYLARRGYDLSGSP